MVTVFNPSKFGILLLLFLLTGLTYADFAPKFKMEFSKKEIFVGEQVMCNFIIYTDSPLIDVEVAKFPEFKGFWVDNLVLRQGPMATNLGLSHRESSVVVGTYLLIPIVDRAEPTIEPMRIVMRNSGTGELVGVAPEYVPSVADPLVIKKLPVNPKAADAALFAGAVGNFEIAVAETRIEFQKDEPVVLRVVVQGEGNFAEINDIKLPLPEKVEILSKRSSTQGVGRFFTKFFEFTLAVHDPKDLMMGPIPFVFFDPTLKKYIRLQTQSVLFNFKETPGGEAAESNQPKPVRLAPYQPTWTIYRPLMGTRYFLLSQIALALLFLSLLIGKVVHLSREKRRTDPTVLRRKAWEDTLVQLQNGNTEVFLKECERLIFEALAARAKFPAPQTTRGKLIDAAKSFLSTEEITAVKDLFAAYDNLLFSPEHRLPTDLKTLASRLGSIVTK